MNHERREAARMKLNLLFLSSYFVSAVVNSFPVLLP
jgi:hypothetical protein